MLLAVGAFGDRVRLVPNHACVAASTQDRLWLVDGQEVIEAMAVDARGGGGDV